MYRQDEEKKVDRRIAKATIKSHCRVRRIELWEQREGGQGEKGKGRRDSSEGCQGGCIVLFRAEAEVEITKLQEGTNTVDNVQCNSERDRYCAAES